MAAAGMASLREQKEAFVSGHSGTSLEEVTLLTAAPVVLLLLWRLARHPAAGRGGLFHTPQPTAAGLALEFGTLVWPLVASLMGLVSPAGLLGTAAMLALALFATQHSEEWQQRRRSPRQGSLTEVLRGSLSSYRASLMLVTLIAILGVDFPAFPRRFAKAETFGTGLMDVGVGSFVAASGLAHGLAAAARAAASGSQRRFPWRRECGRAAALLALGLARLAATRAADYQSHASEYGTHWNFFLTLAALRLLSLVLPGALGGSAAVEGAAGAALLVAHQCALSAWGLIEVVHSDERAGSWLRANKEGLLSLPGYWALQLLSAAAGRLAYRWASPSACASAAAGRSSSRVSIGSGESCSSFHSSSGGGRLRIRTKAPPAPLAPQLRLLWRLGGASAALWAAYWTAAQLQPVSRRACNAAYVLWMLALNVQTVAAFLAADLALPGAAPFTLSALNAAMLPIFLAGNLLTGLVNMSVNTLAASNAAARAIVAAYTAVLCAGAVVAAQRWPPK